MSKKNTDHVLMHDGSKGFFGLFCAHCGQKQPVATPCAIDIMIAIGKTFTLRHRDCKKPQPPTTEAA